MRDLYNKLDVRRGFSPAAAVTDNTAYVSEIIDMQGFSAMAFAILLGSIADADVTFVVLLEESVNADFSSQTAVADADMNGTEALAAPLFGSDDTVRKIGYHGSKRYVRLTITPAANSGDIFLAIVAVMARAAQAPIAQAA